MYVFEALKHIMYTVSTQYNKIDPEDPDPRKCLREIILEPVFSYTSPASFYRIHWREVLDTNAISVCFPSEFAKNKFIRFFSKIRPGTYQDGDGTLLRVNKPEGEETGDLLCKTTKNIRGLKMYMLQTQDT